MSIQNFQDKQKIIPSLWFDNNCEEAINFYASIIPNSKITTIKRYPTDFQVGPIPGMGGKVLTAVFELAGEKFMALDGGDYFKFNPTVSLTITCPTVEETEEMYKKLSEGGETLMPFQKYPWAERYGWFKDRFGLSWQINLEPGAVKIVPSMMFVGKYFGHVEEALDFYTSIFKNSSKHMVVKYEEGDSDVTGKVKYSSFSLENHPFVAMESSADHKFEPNGAISFTVDCEDQAETDYYADKLSANPENDQCGWVQDKYGFSWQIIPKGMGELVTGPDKAGADRALKAMLQMKRINLAKLEEAYKG